MRKAYKYFIPATLAVITLVGCENVDNELEVTGRKNSPNFTATIGGAQTRAFDQSWEPGNEIGISGGGHTNVCYRTNDGDGNFTVKDDDEQIYFQDDNEVDFTAYYPWKDLTGGATTISENTKEQTRQKEFDFLWAKASGKNDAPNVNFTFAHTMAKVSITIKAGTEMTYDEIKTATSLSLKGRFRHTGSFNTADGTATATGSTPSATNPNTLTFTDVQFNDDEETMTCSLIVFPQNLSTYTLTFSTTITLSDGKSLTPQATGISFTNANKEIDGVNAKNEWVAGRQYDLNLIINKAHVTLEGCTITAWKEATVAGADISVE